VSERGAGRDSRHGSVRSGGAKSLRELVFKGRGPDAGSELPPRACIELDSRALVNNFKAIRALVPDQAVLPMVKANAYGHGMEWAASQLTGFGNLYGLGVASLEEGAELRASLGVRGRKIRVIVFSGAAGWTETKGQYCERHGLTPVIASDADWHAFAARGWPGRLAYELKFNTGMNRLGLSPSMARQVAQKLRDKPVEQQPQGVLTHLAMSERPDARLTQQQIERFAAIKAELEPAFPSASFHLANSGAIWNAKRLGLSGPKGGLTDVVRPGLALYGVPPWDGAPLRGLEPVMTYTAQVIAVHALKAGESLGYGGTFSVPGKAAEPVQVAILSAGYGDGVHRMLSNQGHGWLGGRETRFLGMVSMDLCAVGAFASTRVGDRVELFGPHVDPWAQARAAGTIPYELLTSVTARVQRRHV
jgi:alanine racemase